MADKFSNEDLNTHNANSNEEMETMEIEIDEEFIDFFRNETDQELSQGPLDNHSPEESTGGHQSERDSVSEGITEEEISHLMDESGFNGGAEEYPPDDYDEEIWNMHYESLDFIKLPFPI